jgi:hypothetical protein
MLVGKGVVDVNFTTGMVLHGVKLFPNEVAIQVTHVWKPNHWIERYHGQLLVRAWDMSFDGREVWFHPLYKVKVHL